MIDHANNARTSWNCYNFIIEKFSQRLSKLAVQLVSGDKKLK